MFKKGTITSKVPKQKLILTITFSTNYDVWKKLKKVIQRCQSAIYLKQDQGMSYFWQTSGNRLDI